MKSFFLAFWGLVFINPVVAQKYSIEKSHVEFFSKATIEDIKAENTKASGIFNEANGEIVFSIPIQEFQFDKSLMKQHFNEKYMESEKFPKSTFQGKISDYNTDVVGEQKVTASGKLTIHGVVQEVQIPGTIEKNKAAISMRAKFMVKLVDYKIAIPQLLWKNIAEEVEVTVEFNYKPL
jgi:polyisoprenoid-binding protein YceI